MLEDILIILLGQAPWAAIVLLILYFIYRELRKEDRELRKEIASLGKELRGEMASLGKELRGEMGLIKDGMKSLRDSMVSTHFTVIDFMALKGLFTAQESDYLMRQVKRGSASSASVGPLSEGEVKFISEVMGKDSSDKLTPEEMDRVVEILKGAYMKTGEGRWLRLWIQAYMLRAYVYSKHPEAMGRY